MMELQLRYNNDAQLPVAAALLYGNSTTAWLKEIDRWQISPGELSCYILPQSVSCIDPAGLFVIFNNPASVRQIDLLHPYACISNKLYIPCHATLFPQLAVAELDRLLLWPIQVFHPTIGLVGFEESSFVNISDLFVYPTIKQSNWTLADPGLAGKPELQQIIVTPRSAENIMDEIKTAIGQKPIEEIIPPEEKTNPVLENILNVAKLFLFVPLLGVIKLFDLFPKSATSVYSGNTSSNPGLLQQLQSWLQKNLDELQKKRDKELKRLSDLFEKDTNEALQYAIPLNSPYFDRGKQAPSSSILGRRSVNFNLGSLGGGRLVDAWDTSNYYHELRTKYLNAAQKEIAQKDFKKAAYVYAHLLGDYYNAAKTLEQGNFHREAAALYKDHLKNMTAAAACLERGELYTEAIELYKDLKEDEKVGDLYLQIQQENNAHLYYESCVTKKVGADNLLDAARVVQEKMQQEERAKGILLQGWKGNYQHEPCLKKYFDIIINKDQEQVEAAVNHIYKEHTSERKQLPLLHVLEYVNSKTGSEAVLHNNQEIAYEILHQEAKKGNMQNLHSLKKFLPGNKLIGSDTSRYASSSNRRLQPDTITADIQLDKTIGWKATTCYRNQFIAVGIKNNQLHLARANWYGNIEYYSWEKEIKDFTSLCFITAPHYSKDIILHNSEGIVFSDRQLIKNKYFSEDLEIRSLAWMLAAPQQFLIDETGNIRRFEMERGDMTLQQYSMDGTLLLSVNCALVSGTVSGARNYPGQALFFNDGYYYTYTDMRLISISSTGGVKAIELLTGIRMMAASGPGSDFYIVVSTNKGCSICKPFKGELNFTNLYFAEELIPRQIIFLNSNRFVIAEKLKAVVFEITDGIPRLIYEQRTASVIAGILSVPQRNSFAIVEENGCITVHDLDKS